MCSNYYLGLMIVLSGIPKQRKKSKNYIGVESMVVMMQVFWALVMSCLNLKSIEINYFSCYIHDIKMLNAF